MLDTLKAGDVGERIRVAAETAYQALIDTELTATIGPQPWERTETRTNQRNGSRPRTLSTPAGDLQLRIPKLPTGSFFPSLLDGRCRVDQALFAVVMEAYLHGVSTRTVDDLVQALGVASGRRVTFLADVVAGDASRGRRDLVLRSSRALHAVLPRLAGAVTSSKRRRELDDPGRQGARCASGCQVTGGPVSASPTSAGFRTGLERAGVVR